jgi:hypothetical protein
MPESRGQLMRIGDNDRSGAPQLRRYRKIRTAQFCPRNLIPEGRSKMQIGARAIGAATGVVGRSGQHLPPI